MKIAFSPPFIDQSVIDEVVDTLQSQWITTGPKVKELEQEIVKLTDSKAALCVNSWTSGAMLMLKWFGVKEGDEVIVPAYTYCATALSVLHCGATPVMVDIKNDFTIDVEAVKRAITPKTKAIIAVDIAGWPCDYNALYKLVTDPEIRAMFSPAGVNQFTLNRILLISDAAHSIGAMYEGKAAALKSDITIFSFHAVKNITTAEGGCVCLNLPHPFNIDAEYKYLKILTLNGQNKDAFSKYAGAGWKYDVLYQGFKINMPDICAAVGLAQIAQYNSKLLPARKAVAQRYISALKEMSWFIAPSFVDINRESSYHIFPLRVAGISEQQRDAIVSQLIAAGIMVNVHFIPMPMLTLFKSLGYDIANYPNSYKQYACEISLPIYPQLTEEEITYVIESVIEAVELQINFKHVLEVAV